MGEGVRLFLGLGLLLALPVTHSSFRVPLRFEPLTERSGNVQTFVARTDRSEIRVSSRGLDIGSLSMRFSGARSRAAGEDVDRLASTSNYLFGSDPRAWRTNVLNFAQVRYRGIYPGVDLIYKGDA